MDTIELEQRGAIAWVWLNQPQRLNAINPTMLQELRQTWEQLHHDDRVNVIVLAGRGRAFSAGFDIAWMASLDTQTVARELADVRAVYDLIEDCPKPLITAIQGAAMGGGLLFALVADFRILSDQASLGVPEIKIGIFPSLKLVPRLERVVGLGAAKRMVLTGEPISANEAQHLGLADEVVSTEALHRIVQERAEHLAALPSKAVQLSKAAFAAARTADYATWETTRFVECWDLPERISAMRTFLAKPAS